MDVPHTLVELGVDPAATSQIAAAAVVDPSAGGNPIEFNLEFASRIFDAACAGNVDAASPGKTN